MINFGLLHTILHEDFEKAYNNIKNWNTKEESFVLEI